MRQQYDKMNQSIFSSSLRSAFDSGISPHTKCRIFLITLTAMAAGPPCASKSEREQDVLQVMLRHERKDQRPKARDYESNSQSDSHRAVSKTFSRVPGWGRTMIGALLSISSPEEGVRRSMRGLA